MKDKIFGLIGYPLGHSFSKSYFNKKFTNENIFAEYVNFEIEDINDFKEIIKNDSICGLNVTIPHKRAIIEMLNEIDDIAKKVGAVNVIKFIRNGKETILKGYNTDVIGFTNSISKLINKNNKMALILGTGGVSKAIDYSLKEMELLHMR